MATDRRAWLDERRAAVRASFDADAPTYDGDDIPITPVHRASVTRFLGACPPGGAILDAPCGTGKYFELVVASGRTVVGIDQSAGMLGEARARGLAAALELVGLQELAYVEAFDGVMSIDAMENVFPEDWPLVAHNFRRALRPDGHLYLTVEEVPDPRIDHAFAEMTARGWPVVRGEVVEGDTGGYHYYPGRQLVDAWLADAGFELVDEGYNQGEGYGYRHLLMRTR